MVATLAESPVSYLRLTTGGRSAACLDTWLITTTVSSHTPSLRTHTRSRLISGSRDRYWRFNLECRHDTSHRFSGRHRWFTASSQSDLIRGQRRSGVLGFHRHVGSRNEIPSTEKRICILGGCCAVGVQSTGGKMGYTELWRWITMADQSLE